MTDKKDFNAEVYKNNVKDEDQEHYFNRIVRGDARPAFLQKG